MKISKETKAIIGMTILAILVVGFFDYTKPKSIEKNLESIKSRGEYYEDYADTLDLIEVIDSNDLTIEALSNRNGKLVIERVIGIVEDAETGAGSVLNGDKNYYYISYDEVEGIHNGDIICSFIIYDPDTNYEDDIMLRFDYIIDCKGGK